MASKGTNNGTARNENKTEAGGFLIPEIPGTGFQVGVYILWMLLQGINRNLWWLYFLSVLQVVRIMLIGRISKMIFVCALMILSIGWQKLLGHQGTFGLTVTSILKLGIDVTSVMIHEDKFVFWGEICIIITSAIYLIGLLIFKYGKEAMLWTIIGFLTLSVFMLGFFLKDDDIVLLGIMILMNRWDKMKKALKKCTTCFKQTTTINSE